MGRDSFVFDIDGDRTWTLLRAWGGGFEWGWVALLLGLAWEIT